MQNNKRGSADGDEVMMMCLFIYRLEVEFFLPIFRVSVKKNFLERRSGWRALDIIILFFFYLKPESLPFIFFSVFSLSSSSRAL